MKTQVVMRNFLVRAGFIVLTITLIQLPIALRGQESVMDVAYGSEKKADAYFADGSYAMAATLYEGLVSKNVASAAIHLKLAKCNYYQGDFHQAYRWFDEVLKRQKELRDSDRILYAETLASLRRYEEAAEQYSRIAGPDDKDLWIKNKIWRFKSTNFLSEDSAQYSVRRLGINTAAGEFGAALLGKGLVFLSNRKPRSLVRNVDAASGNGFFRLYRSSADTTSAINDFSKPEPFHKLFRSKYHNGPVCFYSGGNKAAYTASSEAPNKSGERRLEIRFAERTKNGWSKGAVFAFNDKNSSNTDPFISEDGRVLYFSSDRKGGFGGKDLYRSVYRNGRWEAPVNLGEIINTPLDERFPFVDDGILYFSSNGQPGLGGLDMFKSAITSESYAEVINLGYPANTHADDFGLVLTEGGFKGYFSSSRSAGTGDDIFELQIDQQSYPLVIDGVLKIKEHSWITTDTLKVLSGAAISLIDHTRNISVGEATADEAGRFSLKIPYFSFYRIRVVHPDGSEAFVSFEIPRKKKEDYFHEIVIVRDAFSGQDEKQRDE